MSTRQGLRAGSSLFSFAATCLRTRHNQKIQCLNKPLATRSMHLLSARRPQILASTISSPPTSATSQLPSATATTLPVGSDLLSKISAHPALASLQTRNAIRDTYDPSHRVRKRRHGFLARLKSKGGRKVLRRRKTKGRMALSH